MKHVAIVLTILLLAGCVRPAPTVSPISPISPLAPQARTPTPIPTLPSSLSNSSMEAPFNCPESATCTAHDWRAWWVNTPDCRPGKDDCYISCPQNCWKATPTPVPPGQTPTPAPLVCVADTGCYWQRPEFSESTLQFAYRVHTGASSQKVFGFGRMFEAGLWRHVTTEPGKLYEFSVYAQSWMCYNYDACQGGRKSDEPTTMHLRVGIDPTSGIDPFAPTVIWGPESDSFDKWTRLSVMARAQSTTITVFTYARPDWGEGHLRINNDVYLDDADLRKIEGIVHFPAVWK